MKGHGVNGVNCHWVGNMVPWRVVALAVLVPVWPVVESTEPELDVMYLRYKAAAD